MALQRSKLTVIITAMSAYVYGLANSVNSLSKSYISEVTEGTSADQADVVFHANRSLTAAASEDLDLSGSLTDPFNATVSLARVKRLVIRNNSTTGTLTIGGAASAAWAGPFSSGGTATIGPECVFVCERKDATGYPVTAGTGDKLKILNNGGTTSTYDIVVVGCSA